MARKKSSGQKTKKASLKAETTQKPKPKTKKVDLQTLNKWNIGLGVLFVLQIVAVAVFSNAKSLPVSVSYITKDSLASQAAGTTVLAPAVRHLFDINLVYLLSAVLLSAATAYILVATLLRKRYENDLGSKVHCMWVEYGVASGLMLMVVAMLNGIYDFTTLGLIFALTVSAGLLALFLERQKSVAASNRWIVNVFAVVFGLLPWLAVTKYLKDALIYGSSGLPAFVYWLDGTIFLLFMAFAAIFYMERHKKGKLADQLYAERVYMVLFFVTTSALVWQVFAGLLR